MKTTVRSTNGIPIRLTEERWEHIVEEHAELEGLRSEILKTVERPIRVLGGAAGELLAVRELELGKFVVVVYRELVDDGFVITAFVTRRVRALEQRKKLWP